MSMDFKSYHTFSMGVRKSRAQLINEVEGLVKAESDIGHRIKPGRLILIEATHTSEFIALLDYTVKRCASIALVTKSLQADDLSLVIERFKPDLLCLRRTRRLDGLVLSNYTEIVSHGCYAIYIRLKPSYDVNHSLCLLMFTSGSDGSPKACKLSIENVTTSINQIIRSLDMDQSDKLLTTLDFAYIYGLSGLLTHMAVGGEILLNDAPLFTQNFLDRMRQTRNYNLNLVPIQVEMYLKIHSSIPTTHLPRFITQAGGKLSGSLIHELARHCSNESLRLYFMYGQTEASPRIAVNPVHKRLCDLGSVGYIVEGGCITPFEDVNDNEIVYHGKNVFCGYANGRGDLLACKSLESLSTGDTGKIHPSDGSLFITGRISRITKVNGLRLNLDFIELSLQGKFGVHEKIAVLEESELLFIICEDTLIDGEEVFSYLRKAFRIPRDRLRFVRYSLIPRTYRGKLDYRRIREDVR